MDEKISIRISITQNNTFLCIIKIIFFNKKLTILCQADTPNTIFEMHIMCIIFRKLTTKLNAKRRINNKSEKGVIILFISCKWLADRLCSKDDSYSAWLGMSMPCISTYSDLRLISSQKSKSFQCPPDQYFLIENNFFVEFYNFLPIASPCVLLH